MARAVVHLPEHPGPEAVGPPERIDPVSYTHLDVYKRQLLYCFLLYCILLYHVPSAIAGPQSLPGHFVDRFPQPV